MEIEGNLFRQRIDFYATKQTLKQEETKEDTKQTIDEGNAMVEPFKNHSVNLGKQFKTIPLKMTIPLSTIDL